MTLTTTTNSFQVKSSTAPTGVRVLIPSHGSLHEHNGIQSLAEVEDAIKGETIIALGGQFGGTNTRAVLTTIDQAGELRSRAFKMGCAEQVDDHNVFYQIVTLAAQHAKDIAKHLEGHVLKLDIDVAGFPAHMPRHFDRLERPCGNKPDTRGWVCFPNLRMNLDPNYDKRVYPLDQRLTAALSQANIDANVEITDESVTNDSEITRLRLESGSTDKPFEIQIQYLNDGVSVASALASIPDFGLQEGESVHHHTVSTGLNTTTAKGFRGTESSSLFDAMSNEEMGRNPACVANTSHQFASLTRCDESENPLSIENVFAGGSDSNPCKGIKDLVTQFVWLEDQDVEKFYQFLKSDPAYSDLTLEELQQEHRDFIEREDSLSQRESDKTIFLFNFGTGSDHKGNPIEKDPFAAKILYWHAYHYIDSVIHHSREAALKSDRITGHGSVWERMMKDSPEAVNGFLRKLKESEAKVQRADQITVFRPLASADGLVETGMQYGLKFKSNNQHLLAQIAQTRAAALGA